MGYYINPFTSRIERYDKFIPDEWGVRVLKSVNYDGIWQQKTELPDPPREKSYICTDNNNNIYVIGGHDGSIYLVKFLKYNVTDETWEELDDITISARSSGKAVYYNEKIYLFGGEDATGVLDEIKIYDLNTNSWGDGGQLPQGPLKDFSCCQNQNMVYFIGGNDGTNYNNKIHSLNLDTNTFTELTILPDPQIKEYDCVFVNGKIYIIGGRKLDDSGYNDYFLCYDVADNSFTQIPSLHTVNVYEPMLFSIENKIYIIGGYYDDGSFVYVFSYDIEKSLWYNHANRPSPIQINTLPIVCNNNVYIIGGNDTSNILKTNMEYNPDYIYLYETLELMKS